MVISPKAVTVIRTPPPKDGNDFTYSKLSKPLSDITVLPMDETTMSRSFARAKSTYCTAAGSVHLRTTASHVASGLVAHNATRPSCVMDDPSKSSHRSNARIGVPNPIIGGCGVNVTNVFPEEGCVTTRIAG